MLEHYASTYPRREFWAALAEGRFELPRCETCDEWQAPGAVKCARCGSGRLSWQRASGGGSVYSLLERLAAPGGATEHILVVSLDEGPAVMGLLRGAASVGMRVCAIVPAAPSPEGLPMFAESVN